MLHKTFILRQLSLSQKQATIFVLCVALSMVTLVALNGFRESINNALQSDARAIQAGDIIVTARSPLSADVADKIAEWEAAGQVERTQLYLFYSMARIVDGDTTLLSDIKVVEPAYPFYGEVILESGRDLHAVLTSGNIVVDQNLLDRLNLELGDQIHLGEMILTIQDVVLKEPDRTTAFFSLGSRIFVSMVDLEALDLMKPGSRINYRTILKVSNANAVDQLTEALDAVKAEYERIENYRTAESGVQRFFENFLFFLSLIGVFTLLLAGIGIQSALTAYLREREKTIAIVKTLGATRSFVTRHYFFIVSVLGTVGTILGFGLGYLLQSAFPILLAGFLPDNVVLTISARTVLESLGLGIFVVAAFTFLPLYNLQDLRPSFIFRKEVTPTHHGWPYYATIGGIYLFFVGLILWQLQNLEVGGYFILGVTGLVLIAALITEVTLRLLRRRRIKGLTARQALRGLFRPRNATRPIVITLSVSMGVIFAIYLIEQNLNTALIDAYPEEAPNVFFIDIQPDQVDQFAQTLGIETTYFPVVPSAITAVNGESTTSGEAREGEDRERRAPEFRLTYREQLLPDEELALGESLFRSAGGDRLQVSILENVFEWYRPFELGDIITFKIQGIPIEAEVVSVRRRTEETPRPLFSFVFQEKALKDAPQTIVTSLNLPPQDIAPLQNRMVTQFPNVTVIDMTQAMATLANIVDRLSQVIRFLSLFSVFAGLLIIVSSVFATRLARIQEAVYFKVLGAKSRFVLNVFTLENVFLGLISAVLALLLSQIGSWWVTDRVFEIDYTPALGASTFMVVLTITLVTAVGLLASVSILRQKPIAFLREQNEDS